MEEREKLLQAFVDAATSGDSNRLLALLSDSVILHSDGGGKAPALPNPIHGPMHVARAILGSLNRLVPPDVTRRLALVNGQPGLVVWMGALAASRYRNLPTLLVGGPDGRKPIDPIAASSGLKRIFYPNKIMRLARNPTAPNPTARAPHEIIRVRRSMPLPILPIGPTQTGADWFASFES